MSELKEMELAELAYWIDAVGQCRRLSEAESAGQDEGLGGS